MSLRRKGSDQGDDERKEKKLKTEEKEEKIEELSPLHKTMIDAAVIGPFIDDEALDQFNPSEKIKIFQMMQNVNEPLSLSMQDILFFQNYKVLANILFIRDIFMHPYPQNRSSGDGGAVWAKEFKGDVLVDAEQVAACQTGIYKGNVYFYTEHGISGPILTESQGLLGLTSTIKIHSKNQDEIKEQIALESKTLTKENVVNYIDNIIKNKIENCKIALQKEKKVLPTELPDLKHINLKFLQQLKDSDLLSLHDIAQLNMDRLRLLSHAPSEYIEESFSEEIPFINSICDYLQSVGLLNQKEFDFIITRIDQAELIKNIAQALAEAKIFNENNFNSIKDFFDNVEEEGEIVEEKSNNKIKDLGSCLKFLLDANILDQNRFNFLIENPELLKSVYTILRGLARHNLLNPPRFDTIVTTNVDTVSDLAQCIQELSRLNSLDQAIFAELMLNAELAEAIADHLEEEEAGPINLQMFREIVYSISAGPEPQDRNSFTP